MRRVSVNPAMPQSLPEYRFPCYLVQETQILAFALRAVAKDFQAHGYTAEQNRRDNSAILMALTMVEEVRRPVRASRLLLLSSLFCIRPRVILESPRS